VGQHVFADTVNLGFVSFDGFIPGTLTSPGVNEFSINNFTGDPALGGFALPPDFPVLDFVTFTNAQLTIEESFGNEFFALGDIGAGTVLSDLITASVDVLSAKFSARLEQTVLTLTLTLADGSTFMTGSAYVEAAWVPSSPPFLAPGDFALITVSRVPEPASWCLLLAVSLPIVFKRRRS